MKDYFYLAGGTSLAIALIYLFFRAAEWAEQKIKKIIARFIQKSGIDKFFDWFAKQLVLIIGIVITVAFWLAGLALVLAILATLARLIWKVFKFAWN